jgi:phosphatidylglycerophosphate synthase
MTGEDHYLEAGRLLDAVADGTVVVALYGLYVARAQAHATLAMAAAHQETLAMQQRMLDRLDAQEREEPAAPALPQTRLRPVGRDGFPEDRQP